MAASSHSPVPSSGSPLVDYLEDTLGAGSEQEEDEDVLTQEVAGQTLYEYLLELKQTGALSAQAVCQLAYWAANAGAQGRVSKLGKAPGDPNTGNYSRHYDIAAGGGGECPRGFHCSGPAVLQDRWSEGAAASGLPAGP